MLKLNSFLNECCFEGCSMGLKVQRNKKQLPVHRTPGSLNFPVPRAPWSLDSPVLRTILDFQRVRFCDSPVLRTILDFQPVRFCDSPVLRTPGSHDSPVLRTSFGFSAGQVLGLPGT